MKFTTFVVFLSQPEVAHIMCDRALFGQCAAFLILKWLCCEILPSFASGNERFRQRLGFIFEYQIVIFLLIAPFEDREGSFCIQVCIFLMLC